MRAFNHYHVVTVLMMAAALAAGADALRFGEPTNWTDCGLQNATMRFTDVISNPNPVRTGQQQNVTKLGYTIAAHAKISVVYEQFWHVFGKWIRFLKLEEDTCAEHPGICPTPAGKKSFEMVSIHPKLNPLTPHGLYRSLQHYKDDEGRVIGCVDIIVPYEK